VWLRARLRVEYLLLRCSSLWIQQWGEREGRSTMEHCRRRYRWTTWG